MKRGGGGGAVRGTSGFSSAFTSLSPSEWIWDSILTPYSPSLSPSQPSPSFQPAEYPQRSPQLHRLFLFQKLKEATPSFLLPAAGSVLPRVRVARNSRSNWSSHARARRSTHVLLGPLLPPSPSARKAASGLSPRRNTSPSGSAWGPRKGVSRAGKAKTGALPVGLRREAWLSARPPQPQL